MSIDIERARILAAAFRMPLAQTMVSRKSSITNAFVNALIPAIPPTHEEIEQALAILEMDPNDVRCAYCGDPSTEWDHLRPLVVDRRPTGYISEIGNLVPACGKCNQSKGNKHWLIWMQSQAPRSPVTRRTLDLDHRIRRLRAYEQWKPPTPIDFRTIIGDEEWAQYWAAYDQLVAALRTSQSLADALKTRIAAAHARRQAQSHDDGPSSTPPMA